MRLYDVFLLITIYLTISGALADNSKPPERIDLFWALVGSNPEEEHLNPYYLTRDDKTIDVAAIVYTIRREAKSLEQISNETGLDKKLVSQKLAELQHCELIRNEENRFLVNFPVWDSQIRNSIISLGMDLANRVADAIIAELPAIKQKFNRSSLPSQGYTWNRVASIIVGGLLLDTGLNDRGLRKWGIFDQKRDTPIRPGGYYYWFRAIEGGWGDYWKFGHDLISNPDRSVWFCMFYGQRASGNRINWSQTWDTHAPSTPKIIFPLVCNDEIIRDSLLIESGLSEQVFQSDLSKMADAGLILLRGNSVIRAFPVFNKEDIGELITNIDRICDNIIDSIYASFLTLIRNEWRRIAPGNWKIENVETIFIREVFDRQYNLTLHLLIEKGILPPPPVKPPFDYFGINGPFDML